MKQLVLTGLAAIAAGAAALPAQAEDVKLGILLGFTGPLESYAAPMAGAAKLAIDEVNRAGTFLGGGSTVVAVEGDDTCIDAGAATASAERLITSDGVKGIVGGLCSGVTTAALQNVALPNGVVMISPSATSPALSTVEDDGLFFRTAPSDARQGEIVAEILTDRGVESVAITYTNNDYGKGLSDAIERSFTAAGGTVTINSPHEDGKGDYAAEVATLAAAGGDVLVVAGYLDQGGQGIIRAALDTGAFDVFFLPDGMFGTALVDAIGEGLNGSYGDVPGTDNEGAATFASMMEEAGVTQGAFAAESYDAAALILLAMQAANSSDPGVYKTRIMDVANAPGEEIQPGELGKALEILASGGDVDYVGAAAVELIGAGESAGNYREYEVKDGELVTVRYR